MIDSDLLATKLVIFDCDGVLVDSEGIANKVLSETLEANGLHISKSELLTRFRGMKLRECLDTLEQDSGIKLPPSLEVNLRQRMSLAFSAHLQPIKGALQLIESLRIPFCVASNGPRNKIEENLRTTQLHSHFVGNIFSAYEVGSWKPDPGLFLAAAQQFRVTPKECIVIEDSASGVNAAIAAGMTVFALNTSLSDSETETLTAADKVFTSLCDIHSLLVSQDLSRG